MKKHNAVIGFLGLLIGTAALGPVTKRIHAEPPGAADEQADIEGQLKRLRSEIGHDSLMGSAKKWWDAFEKENETRKGLVLKLAQQLAARRATIQEFFLAYVYSDSDNIQANLHYLDYSRRLRLPDDFPAGLPASGDASEETVADLKREAGWDQTGSDARRWWGELEEAHREEWRYLASILRELKKRKATITDLFLASINGGGGIAASLDYLDYARFAAGRGRIDQQQASRPSRMIREHPLQALRVPVRVYWATTETSLVNKASTAPADTELQARFWCGYIDVLLRQSDPSAKDSDPLPELKGTLKRAQSLVTANPKDPFFLDLLAVAQFANGHAEEALKAAEGGLAAANGLPPSLRRERAIQLLTRHRAEFRAGLPDKVPAYELGSGGKEP